MQCLHDSKLLNPPNSASVLHKPSSIPRLSPNDLDHRPPGTGLPPSPSQRAAPRPGFLQTRPRPWVVTPVGCDGPAPTRPGAPVLGPQHSHRLCSTKHVARQIVSRAL